MAWSKKLKKRIRKKRNNIIVAKFNCNDNVINCGYEI